MTAHTFIADHVQIGRQGEGSHGVAQNGQVRVQDGELMLLDSDGKLVDTTSVRNVELDRGGIGGAVTYASFGGKKYSLVVGGGGDRLAIGLLRVFVGRSGGRKLIAAVEAEKHRAA